MCGRFAAFSAAEAAARPTLHRLAEGLGVKVDEFFVDPAQLLYRRFDRRTNPVVAEVIDDPRGAFRRLDEADFDELHSRVGTGGALTIEGALGRRPTDEPDARVARKLDLLLESSQAEVAAGFSTCCTKK